MRILHTMLRVGDLERSIKFYTEVLGMKLLRTSENAEYKYTLAFVGYGDESTAYGHIALGVDDIYSTIEAIRAAGGKITREPGPVLGGKTVIAFAEDPDGYKIEFIANKEAQAALGN